MYLCLVLQKIEKKYICVILKSRYAISMSRPLNNAPYKPFFNVIEPPGYEYNPGILNRIKSVNNNNNIQCDANGCFQIYGQNMYSISNTNQGQQSTQPTKYLSSCDPIRKPNYS